MNGLDVTAEHTSLINIPGFYSSEGEILKKLPFLLAGRVVQEEIIKRGYNYTASATLTEEWYDTRSYENFTLPQGNYYSLRIIIGEGVGKNWWCVMFPPLCLDIATENAPADDGIVDYTKSEINLITNRKYTVKFKILELLSDAFG